MAPRPTWLCANRRALSGVALVQDSASELL